MHCSQKLIYKKSSYLQNLPKTLLKNKQKFIQTRKAPKSLQNSQNLIYKKYFFSQAINFVYTNLFLVLNKNYLIISAGEVYHVC